MNNRRLGSSGRAEWRSASLFLYALWIGCNASLPQAVAGICQDVHKKLQDGQAVSRQEADTINTELTSDKNNPFNHMVAAEVSKSLGLDNQAHAQFEEADRLQKGYVQKTFTEELSERHQNAKFMCQYVQEKHPKDAAVLFYLARTDVASLDRKNSLTEANLDPIIEKLKTALSSPKPWPGTLSLLAMLEYNKALSSLSSSSASNSDKNSPDRKEWLNLALEHSSEELKKDPDNMLAMRVRLLCLAKCGTDMKTQEGTILRLLAMVPDDSELNNILARIYMDRKDYNAAIRPVLRGLLAAENSAGSTTAQIAIRTGYELAKRADPHKILDSMHELFVDPGVICIQVADMLTAAGKSSAALELLNAASKDCKPTLRPLFELRQGQLLAQQRRYADALPYLNQAIKEVKSPFLEQKIQALRNRVMSLQQNSQRDVSLHIKYLLSAGRRS